MDITDIFSNISSIAETGAFLLIALLLLVAIFTDRLFFLEILYQKLVGKDFKIHNPKLAEIMNDEFDLIKIKQAFPQLKLQSTRHALGIFKICEDYKIPRSLAKYIGKYFTYDPLNEDNVSINPIEDQSIDRFFCRIMQGITYFLLSLTISMLLFSGNFGTVFVVLKETHHIVWINSDKTVTNFRIPYTQKLEMTPLTCTLHKPEPRFSKLEHNALCDMLVTEGTLEKFIDKEKLKANIAFFVFLIVIAPGVFLFRNERKRIEIVDKLRLQIQFTDQANSPNQ